MNEEGAAKGAMRKEWNIGIEEAFDSLFTFALLRVLDSVN